MDDDDSHLSDVDISGDHKESDFEYDITGIFSQSPSSGTEVRAEDDMLVHLVQT